MKSLLLVGVYVCYLLLGAKIFQKLEQPAETEKCKKAQMGIMKSVVNFGESYFYELNLNQKFCEGIGRAKELGKLEAFYSTPVINVFYYWHGENCSQTAYDKLFSVITSKGESFLFEFQKLFFELQSNSGMHATFDDEMINIKGRVLRDILRRVAKFSATNYSNLKVECELKWSFNDAFFFAGTIATTIGYGRNVPETESGKAFCIGFILLGIPYFAYMMACISEDIKIFLKRWKKRIELTKQRTVSPSSIMLAYTFSGSIMLILIPSWIFRYMEATHVLNESACLAEFINPMPTTDVNNVMGVSQLCTQTVYPRDKIYLFTMYKVAVFFWILLGLVWLGGVISLISDTMSDTTKKLSKRIKKRCTTCFKQQNKQIQYNGALNTPFLDEKVYCLDTQF